MHIIDYINLVFIPTNFIIVILALFIHHRHPENQVPSHSRSARQDYSCRNTANHDSTYQPADCPCSDIHVKDMTSGKFSGHSDLNRSPLTNKRKQLDIMEIIRVSIVMLIGALIRFVNLTELPAGLHQDEASIGYEAFALANFGIDRNGYSFPVYPVTYGSGGGSPMLIYINMLTTKLFGSGVATLRGTTAFFGVLTLLLFYLIIRRLWDKKTAFAGLILLTIMPWHIILSRWSLDSNTMPFFICLATLVFIYAADHDNSSGINTNSAILSCSSSKHTFSQSFLYCLSAALYALCLYNYGSATIVVPLHLIIICIYCIRHQKLSIKQLLYSFCAFIVVLLPLIVFYCINYLDLPELVTPWFSFEKFTSNRIGQVFVTFDSTLLQQLWTNFKALVRMMTIGCTAENESLVNFLPGFSLLFEFTFPITFLGIGSSIARIYKGRVKKNFSMHKVFSNECNISVSGQTASKFENDAVMMSLLASSCIMALFMQADTSRMVIIFIPLVYFMTMGFKFIFEEAFHSKLQKDTATTAKSMSFHNIKRTVLRFATALSGLTVIAAGCLFLYEYSTEYNDMTSYIFMPGYGDAMAAADNLYHSYMSENNLSGNENSNTANYSHSDIAASNSTLSDMTASNSTHSNSSASGSTLSNSSASNSTLSNSSASNSTLSNSSTSGNTLSNSPTSGSTLSGNKGIHVYSTYDNVSAPYMITLYYTQTPPAVFCETVKYKDDTAEFRMASSFSHFIFGFDQSLDSKITAAQNDTDAEPVTGKDLSDNIFVVSHAQEAAFDTSTCEITEYGNYAVVVGKS